MQSCLMLNTPRSCIAAFKLYQKCIIKFSGFEMCCVGQSCNAVKARRYCSALWCNPWYLVCAAEVKSWTWSWPSLERELSSEVRHRPKAEGGYSQVPLSLPHMHRSSPCPRSPPTRKQLASVIRFCTYFHHFISSDLFVCFSIMTKVSCPLVTALLITITSHLGARSGREKEGKRDLEGPNMYHCRELNSRWRDNEENKQTII